MTKSPLARRLRLLAGLLLAGQGLLVVLGILDHEVPRPVAWGLVAAGALLLLWGGLPALRLGRARLVLALGLVAVVGVLAYNLAAGSGLSLPEWAILGYGAALALASRHLARRVGPVDVGTLVAYSFPLVLAPLSLFAINAATTTGLGGSPLGWYIRYLLVLPMGALLSLGGIDASMLGDTVRLATPRGPLFLTVGVVCAGLYAGALFLGVFGLFAWQQETPPRRLAVYMLVGLAGVHVANVVRLVLLGVVGYKWGGEALQDFHQHAGWVLFLAWMILFWALVLRRFEGRAPAAPQA